MLALLIATIPAPPFSTISLGAFSIHIYGICIAAAILVGLKIAERGWMARGGNRDDVATIALLAVPAGIIGARLFHVVTDFRLYKDNPWKALAVWDGGLGIWGGVAGGVAAGVAYSRHRKLDTARLLDVAAPAIVIAQAIGRLGNYFNQELFGRPTNLAWALNVDPEFRPEQHMAASTFHPTFLYESLANLAIGIALIVLARKRRWAAGRIFALYVLAYCCVRILIEQLRIDPANTIFGFRLNTWTALLGIAISAFFVVRLRFSHAA